MQHTPEPFRCICLKLTKIQEKERKKGQEKERYEIRIMNERKLEIIEELTREKDGEGKEKETDREKKRRK